MYMPMLAPNVEHAWEVGTESHLAGLPSEEPEMDAGSEAGRIGGTCIVDVEDDDDQCRLEDVYRELSFQAARSASLSLSSSHDHHLHHHKSSSNSSSSLSFHASGSDYSSSLGSHHATHDADEASIAVGNSDDSAKASAAPNVAGIVHNGGDDVPKCDGSTIKTTRAPHGNRQKYYSQPNPHHAHDDKRYSTHSGPLPASGRIDNNGGQNNPGGGGSEEYAIFKTRAALKLERRFSRLNSSYIRGWRGADQLECAAGAAGGGGGGRGANAGGPSSLPAEPNAERYFSALQGPELDVLKESEDTVLSVERKWPFLLRFPIGCFGICLGLASQAILWKALAEAATMRFVRAPGWVHAVLWGAALVTLIGVFGTYAAKCALYFEAVRREFRHPVRANFFFAPWIAAMFLALGAPPRNAANDAAKSGGEQATSTSIHGLLWALFITPVLALELHMYGQWLSGGQRRLSEVVNPSAQLSLLANFAGALLAASVGWTEFATFFWAVGLAHYVVLFVTLYQRLPTAAVVPKELHPVFFLFVAAPSSASLAWAKIVGDFDLVSRITYFIGLFLYSSLVVRINFFRGFRFSIAWWAYTSPMTSSAIATIQYSLKVRHPFTQFLALLLSSVSSVTVVLMSALTLLHIFYWRDMFPNDVAIAITNERRQQDEKQTSAPDDPKLDPDSALSRPHHHHRHRHHHHHHRHHRHHPLQHRDARMATSGAPDGPRTDTG